jgi:hypothetical protein
MPEIDFFAEREDEQEMICHFFELGFLLVPELDYESSELMFISDQHSYDNIRSQTNSFFLLHNDCKVSPLITFKIGGSGWNAGKYAIHQRQGGPALHFVSYVPFEKGGIRWLRQGLVSCYATYKNSLTGVYEKIPSLMKSKYKQIADHIKRDGHLMESECLGTSLTRKFYILPHAYQALKKGARLGVEALPELKVAGLEEFPWALTKPGD